ncbi:Flp pilus assembly protein CpaB [Archangium sp.]|uniref:Flp pilus assembly protein CpaB n=1 Tax=Archangium sp. TaxID=1872627 RepID=UPI002D4A24EB|nr:Flp pilus assembly protein CpaB [Archangium sp.]HYO56745.1 Flp pilus assembly protein CpaB [Archangium sp.]
MLKGKTPLLIALGLGLLAGIIAWSAIKKKELDVRRGWNLVSVVVASRGIPEGTVITSDMISHRAVPEQFVTSSVVKPDLANYVVGQKVLVALQLGDPLLWSQFETTKVAERLSTKVQKKVRAITIESRPTTSVGGWIRPNDHVDVIGTFRDPQTDENVAVTLLQNVIVLATGKVTGTTNVNLIPEHQREYTHITLMVIPEEAEILTLASELGNLTLSLRNENDVDMIEERGRATISTLLSGERTRVLEQKRREIIQIIKGSTSEKSSVGSGESH